MNDAAITAMPEAAPAAADHVPGDANAKPTLLQRGDGRCPACIRAAPPLQHPGAARVQEHGRAGERSGLRAIPASTPNGGPVAVDEHGAAVSGVPR